MRPEWQAHIDEMLARYRDVRERIGDMQQRMEALRATAESDDGMVTATVDAHGRLTALELNPRVMRMLDSHTLAESIVATADRAADDVRAQMRELVLPFVPDDLGDLGGMAEGLDVKRLLPEDPTDLSRLRADRA